MTTITIDEDLKIPKTYKTIDDLLIYVWNYNIKNGTIPTLSVRM